MATDKRLDQVSQLTDFDYALLVKGDQVGKMTKQQVAEAIGNLLYGATTKETLASVVAGVMGNPLATKSNVVGGTNFNDVTDNGVYSIFDNEGCNGPMGTGIRVILSVVKTSLGTIRQDVARWDAKGVYTRSYHINTSSWQSWQRLDNFGYNTLDGLATALKPLLGLS